MTALLSVGVVGGMIALDARWTDTAVEIVPSRFGSRDSGTPFSPEPGPAKTVLVRVDAPEDGCWWATIDGRLLRTGCGSVAFPLEVQGYEYVSVHFERQMPGDWHFSAAIEADGRIVQTVGPTSTQYPSLDIGYRIPETGLVPTGPPIPFPPEPEPTTTVLP